MAEQYYQSAYTGEQIDESIGRIVNGEIDQLASDAANSASAAQSAYKGVQSALNNLPDGDTLIINDLTTGGTKAALSAEMGKSLNSGKVNKAGDTLKGNLTISKDVSPTLELSSTAQGLSRIHKNASLTGDYGTLLSDFDASGNSVVLSLRGSRWETRNEVATLTFRNADNTISNKYDIIHTGNKPSGSYTGNGDTAERVIETGGIGSVIAVRSARGIAIVCGSSGCLSVAPSAYGGISRLDSDLAIFSSGVLTLKVDHSVLNENGVKYYYQVL